MIYSKFEYQRKLKYLALVVASFSLALSVNSAFKARGGKLIVYQGWFDEPTLTKDVPNYFDEVVRKMNSGVSDNEAIRNTQSFFRAFMVPGIVSRSTDIDGLIVHLSRGTW